MDRDRWRGRCRGPLRRLLTRQAKAWCALQSHSSPTIRTDFSARRRSPDARSAPVCAPAARQGDRPRPARRNCNRSRLPRPMGLRGAVGAEHVACEVLYLRALAGHAAGLAGAGKAVLATQHTIDLLRLEAHELLWRVSGAVEA